MKQAIGTAYEASTASSPVWFTLAQGILTEVFYPSPDQVQVGDLQFLVTDGHGFFSDQKSDCTSQVNYLDEGMTVVVTGQEKMGRYSYEQQIVTDSVAAGCSNQNYFSLEPTRSSSFHSFQASHQ